MEARKNDIAGTVRVKTEQDIEVLLKKADLTAEEMSDVRRYCTEDINVSGSLKDQMRGSGSFVIALIKYSNTLSVEECDLVFGLYSSTQSEELRRKIENELVIQNKPLAYKLAMKAKKTCNIEEDDLIQEALLSLCESIHKYDASFNTKFSTFAFKHITLRLNRYIENNRSLLKIPDTQQYKARKYSFFEQNYIIKHPNASAEEIVYAAMESIGFTESDIKAIVMVKQCLSIRFIELESKETDSFLKDCIRDENSIIGFENVLDECFRNEFVGFLKEVLPPTQYHVIMKYYGLDGNEPKNFREIDEMRGVKGRPGSAAFANYQKAITKLKAVHMKQLGKFAKSIGVTTEGE